MRQFWSKIILFYHIQKFNFSIWVRCKFLKFNDDEFKILATETTNAVSDIVMSQAPVIGSIVARLNATGDRIKQQQINAFLENFVSALLKIEKNQINWTRFESIDFYFMMNSVTERVHHTKAKEKLYRFQEILINDLKTSYYSDFKETFLDLILRLNEDQIEILREFQKVNSEFGPLLRERHDIDGQQEQQRLRRQKILKPEDFRFDLNLYSFYIQDLISKSLIYDDGMGRYGTGPLKVLDITQFGIEFLKFIENTDAKE